MEPVPVSVENLLCSMQQKKMKFSETKTKWVAIAVFYIIAVVTRAIVLKYQDLNADNFIVWLWNWARGIGPCLGTIAAVLVFKRKFYCNITGTSILILR